MSSNRVRFIYDPRRDQLSKQFLTAKARTFGAASTPTVAAPGPPFEAAHFPARLVLALRLRQCFRHSSNKETL